MSKANILIVEDEAIVAADIAAQLDRLGYKVSGQTARGDEAVALAGRLRPDLVLMDIRLAGPMDGVEAAEAIRRDSGVPVIFLTAHSDAATLERAKLTDPFGCILKPFEELDLSTQIEMALYRHRSERALRDNEERFRALAAATFEGIAITENGIVLDANEQFAKMFGYALDEVIGQPAAKFQVPEDRERLNEAFRRGGEHIGEYRGVRKDGSSIVVEVRGRPFVWAGRTVRVAALRDITERKRAEAVAARYHLISQHARDPLLLIEDGGRIVEANQAAVDFYGYSHQALLELSVKDLRIAEDAETAERQMGEAMESGLLFETWHLNKAGAKMPVEVNSRGVIVDGRRMLLSVIRDVSSRKQAAAELHESEARYRSLFENNMDAIFSVNSEGRFLAVNPAAEALCGYSSEELQSMVFPQLCAPEHLEETMAAFTAGLDVRQPGIETAMIGKDGRRVELFVTGVPVKAEGKTTTLFCIARDITLHKQLELERHLTVELLDLTNSSTDTRSLMAAVVEFFHRHSGCDAVGIRLREGDDYPYFESHGFSPDFIIHENSLCVRDSSGCIQRDSKGKVILYCTCGDVLRDQCDIKQCLTPRGTFWTADVLGLAGTLPEAALSRARGQCVVNGYQSVALIPLGKKGNRIGLLQLNSLKKGHFTPDLIAFWERLAEKLSTAIEKFRAEDALRNAHDELEQKVLERTADFQAANAALGASEERFRQMAETLRVIADNLPDGAIYRFVRDVNGCGRYSYLSEGIERLRGISVSNALLTPGLLEGTVHPEDLAWMRQAEDESARTLAPFNVEGRIRTPSGEEKWLHWRSAPRRLEDGGTLWDGVITDITARKASEAALRRANSALLMLQDCANALERASTESELLKRICEIVLQIDGMKMAWVGFAGQDKKKTVRPVAQARDSAGYLKAAKITWADEPRGRGPTGTAIRTRKLYVCRDICSDECVAPWRAQQLQRGYAASIALPLIWDERCLGALTIYSAHADAFNEQEVNLLTQLAGDLTYGIMALRTRAERAQLQRELLTISEREKLLISQELHDGLCQNLAGTSMMVSMLARSLAVRDDRDAGSAKQICALLNSSVNEARNLSHGLHPVGPEGEGLMNALTELAGTVTNLFHIRCAFHCPEPVILENGPISTHLFRIAQEAINNARKHGEADEVRIGLTSTAEGITLTIQDNGVGISSDLSKKRGMGLKSMGYRAAEIGATLSVRRGDGRGTVVTCTLRPPDLLQKGGAKPGMKMSPVWS